MRLVSVSAAVFRKELTIARRSPLLLVLSVVVPLVFVAIFALVIHTSATNPVAVAQQSHGEYTDAFMEELQSRGSSDGPFFSVVTTDPQEAQRAFQQHRVPAVIHLPPSFEDDVAGPGPARVRLQLFNIDSDTTKNVHLRLEHVVRSFTAKHLDGDEVEVAESTVFPADTPMTRYFGSALLVFAVLYSGLVNTGTLFAREWEDRTAKGVVLSPGGFAPLIAGKWAASAALTVGSVALAGGMIVFLLDYPVWRTDLLGLVALGAVFLLGSAVGSLLGIKLKSALLLVPASAVIAIAHLLLAGFESYLRGFAHGGALEVMWRIGSAWPVSGLTDHLRAAVEGFAQAGASGGTWSALGWTLGIALLLIGMSVRHLRMHLTFAQGM